MSDMDEWMERLHDARSPAEWAKIRRELIDAEGVEVARGWLDDTGVVEMLADRCAKWFPARGCKTCSECERGDHHWIGDTNYGDLVEDPKHPAAVCGLDVWDVCKHCDGVFRPLPDGASSMVVSGDEDPIGMWFELPADRREKVTERLQREADMIRVDRSLGTTEEADALEIVIKVLKGDDGS